MSNGDVVEGVTLPAVVSATEEPVHAGNGDRVAGHGDEARVGAIALFVQEIAEALDVIIVERRGGLVEYADRR
jgi:hypothetical protein